VVSWMATETFREIVRVHRAVCGERVTIYFRPTDKGLVRIALHSGAPGYVGFRAREKDEGHVLHIRSSAPTEAELRERLCEFEHWLPTVRRKSTEEQGVMPWLRRALDRDLFLSDLGNDWAFLHQEWRWISDGRDGKKSDVLAVHLPTGRLGIVEFKADEKDLPQARAQVEEYAAFWSRDSQELALFFTALLQAMGAAYGNTAMTGAEVTPEPARLFVGTASPLEGIRIWER
jgi:hypothetical protein